MDKMQMDLYGLLRDNEINIYDHFLLLGMLLWEGRYVNPFEGIVDDIKIWCSL